MTDLRERLRDADPVRTEPALPPAEVSAMRRRVLDAVQAPRGASGRWTRTLAIAGAALLIAGAAIDTHRRTSLPQADPGAAPVPVAGASSGKTQLHFSTPGGTRIIWTLDPAFQLTEKR